MAVFCFFFFFFLSAIRIRQNIISTIMFSTVLEVPKANPFPSFQISKPLLTSTHYDRTASGVHRFSHSPHSSFHETAYPVFFRVTKFIISLPLPITVLQMFANVFQTNYSKILLHDASLFVATRPFDLCWKALKKGHGTDIGPLLTDTENALYYDYISFIISLSRENFFTTLSTVSSTYQNRR